jgi:hypothetical protein
VSISANGGGQGGGPPCYHRRWSTYFDFVARQLAGAPGAAPDFFALESGWIGETDPHGAAYAPVPRGDAVAVAVELYEREIVAGH